MSGTDLAQYPNLWKRGSRYYVRVRVPTDLRLVEKREHIAVNQAARYGDRGMVPVLNRAVRKLKFGDFRLSEYGQA